MLDKLPYCALSFGGGVQSSAIYLMLIHEPWRLLDVMGELPDKVYFADTGAETKDTYKAVNYMQSFKSKVFEIEVVSNGNILERQYTSGDYNPLFPFFIKQLDGGIGMAKRQCTSEYKIRAIQKACREAFKLTNVKLMIPTVSQWLGISIDEPERIKTSEGKGFITQYPLVQLGWDRKKCIEYCESYNWTPTKSRCFMCPYQSDANWLQLKRDSPDEFEEACLVDEKIRETLLWGDATKNQTTTSQSFLHRSCIPLRNVKFKGENNLFADECQGVCNT
ncbi:hypothetical protein [uncultured Nostoc sp.]|uniref:hypothetical protein n=1 Tax=uncultured Nostoc sp. TaxID=340711 RepID=UPI0035CB413D